MREYESGSEESLSKFLFNESLAMQQQNYGCYSKYNESYVPTNPDRRLSFERRGSSTSHDDILLNNNLQQQYLQIDPRYRDSRNIVNNISCNSDIKWDANPSILIEEYDDEQLNFNKSSDSIHQPLNEECIASCIDSDDIPFIDEENTSSSNLNQEIKNNSSGVSGIMIDRNNRRGSNGCRKTVSFDTINECENYDDESNVVNQHFNKSKTCEYFNEKKYDVDVDDDDDNDDDDDCNHYDDGTINEKETIFKFCKMKPSIIKKCDDDDFTIENDDSLSFYFCKNDGLTIKDDGKNSKKMNLKELSIDLSELTSDSTNNSSSNEIRCVKSVTIKTDVPKNLPYKVIWTKPSSTNNLTYGNGKVKALTKYFDCLQFSDENLMKESQSTPDLRFDNNLITKEECTRCLTDNKKLTSNEQNLILKQLKEWSQYGTMGKTDSITKCYLHNELKPLSASVLNLSSENYGKCRYLEKIYNKIDKVDINVRKCKSKSTPNIDEYILHEDLYKIETNIPDAFIINKNQFCKNKCNTIENRDINLTKNSYSFYNKSCPELFKRSQSDLINSPFHTPKNMTLKQIKKNKRIKNGREFNIHRSDVVDMG